MLAHAVPCKAGDTVVVYLPTGQSGRLAAKTVVIDRIYNNTMVLHFFVEDLLGNVELCDPKWDDNCFMDVPYSEGIVEQHQSICTEPEPVTAAPETPAPTTTTLKPEDNSGGGPDVSFLWWVFFAICIVALLLLACVRRPQDVAISGRYSADDLKMRDSRAFHVPRGPRDSHFLRESQYWSIARSTASKLWMNSFGTVIKPNSQYNSHTAPRQPKPVTPARINVRRNEAPALVDMGFPESRMATPGGSRPRTTGDPRSRASTAGQPMRPGEIMERPRSVYQPNVQAERKSGTKRQLQPVKGYHVEPAPMCDALDQALRENERRAAQRAKVLQHVERQRTLQQNRRSNTNAAHVNSNACYRNVIQGNGQRHQAQGYQMGLSFGHGGGGHGAT